MTLQLKNIATIAHVDHGKTTLVDAMLRQSGTFQSHETVAERVMDNLDLEKERGITIMAKNASFNYKGFRVNLVDTPGHADFGGEVERTLMMVDGAILLVDAAEGPLPQTRFVLQKAVQRNLSMIVMINKVDRPDARIDEVEEAIQDLFMELSTDAKHLDFPILYGSGRDGWCSLKKGDKKETLEDLFECIIKGVPEPQVKGEGSLQMLINNLSYSPYLGRLAIGRVERGEISVMQNILLMGADNKKKQARVVKVLHYQGLQQAEAEKVGAGDIAIVATGEDDIQIGDTIADFANPEALPRIEVDPPTVSVELSVNTSPLAGKEGTYLTSRKLIDYLKLQAMHNVALRIEETESPEVCILKARGELQIAIVIENLRRTNGECMVGRPKIISKQGPDGKLLDPIERLVLDVPETSVGVVTEKLSIRKGRMLDMRPVGEGRVRIEFSIPSRGLLGYRSIFLTDTRGEGLMSSYVEGFEESRGEIAGRLNGALVSDRTGVSTRYALCNLEERGRLFIAEGESVYEGMVIGEHNRDNDLDVNAVREKKLTNMRASGTDESLKLSPIRKMTVETALDWIDDNEWIEVTPKNIRIRKRVLESVKR